MKSVNRTPTLLLSEAAPMLAFKATAALYEEQPELWKLGERGRARTLEDFGHHFGALAPLDAGVFREHVLFCEQLFDNHGFPRAWLTDAWRIMAQTIREEMSESAAIPALDVLRSVTP